MSGITRVMFFIFLCSLILNGCSTLPAKKYMEFTLNPAQVHEECIELSPGDVLNYEFDCTRWPVNFDIHYQEAGHMIYKFTKSNTAFHRGKFYPDRKRRYCLAWKNIHSSPTRLKYSLSATGE